MNRPGMDLNLYSFPTELPHCTAVNEPGLAFLDGTVVAQYIFE
jgi:hypothetical protein